MASVVMHARKSKLWVKVTLVSAIAATAVFLLVIGLGEPLYRSYVQDSANLNFEIRAEYDVEGVRYTGSSIWNMESWIAKFPTSASRQFRVSGEAFALEGGSRSLFVLRREKPAGTGYNVGHYPSLCEPVGPYSVSQSLAWLREQFVGPCEVGTSAEARLPTLIEIGDLEDPSSIRELAYSAPDPSGACPSVCLRSLEVQRSSLPIRTGIDQKLPWLRDLDFAMTDVATGQVGASARSSGMGFKLLDFSTELGNGRMYEL